MRLDRPLTLILSALIVMGAWATAIYRGMDLLTLATTGAITLLCAAIILHYISAPARPVGREDRGKPSSRDEAALEFRRGLFNLCAALKLGIRFCENHLDSEPDALIEQLQQMSDNIDAFVNEATRPVRFRQRGRWPFRITPHRRAQ